MDLRAPTWGVPQQVFAVAKGEVVAVCPNGVVGGCFFGPTRFSTNEQNHGLQGVVILKHTVAGSGISYTLYGHLGTVETFQPGECIEQDTLIGATGGLVDAHLHFEVKNAPVLSNPVEVAGTCINPPTQTPSKTCWGYALVNPNTRGYHDPVEYLHLLDKDGFPKAVTISDEKNKKEKNINARRGPGAFGEAYSLAGKAEEGFYTALSKVVGATVDPNCVRGWYQIQHASTDCSVLGNCFTNNPKSTNDSVPEAWVCGDFVKE
jgi:murein DD-endopeptidase MepM/ murein hydrolase activator NlpD